MEKKSKWEKQAKCIADLFAIKDLECKPIIIKHKNKREHESKDEACHKISNNQELTMSNTKYISQAIQGIMNPILKLFQFKYQQDGPQFYKVPF